MYNFARHNRVIGSFVASKRHPQGGDDLSTSVPLILTVVGGYRIRVDRLTDWGGLFFELMSACDTKKNPPAGEADGLG